MTSKENKIAVIGLGYVGLPLALAFSKKNSVIGFDINKNRIKNLIKGIDDTGEVSKSEILISNKIKFSNNIDDLIKSNIYIVTVPTPVDKKKDLI